MNSSSGRSTLFQKLEWSSPSSTMQTRGVLGTTPLDLVTEAVVRKVLEQEDEVL